MNARNAALNVISDVLRKHEYLHLALKKISLPDLREQRFLSALVNAVLENLFRIDYILGNFVQVKKNRSCCT